MALTAQYLRSIAMQLSALSESGLAYSRDHFDIGRFHEIGHIAHDIMSELTVAEDRVEYDAELARVAGYTTPKIDVRGGIFDSEGRVLLVQERADAHKWTLPGGWCDILERPREAIEREVREEAGVTVQASHLAAVFDREVWPHEPKYDRHTYKLFFVCDPIDEVDLNFTSHETSGLGWFSVDELPPLSISRVLPQQIEILCQHWREPGPAHVD